MIYTVIPSAAKQSGKGWIAASCRALLAMTILLISPALAEGKPVPRVLIALYDSREEGSPRTTLIHRYLEMPANHLGLDVRYHDVNAPLPALDENMRGILIWFNRGMEVPDAEAYLDWLDAATQAGKKLVIFEHMGLGDRWRRDAKLMDKANRILARIGLRDTNRWQSLTYEVSLARSDRAVTGFERAYETPLPPYMDTRAVGAGVSHLSVALATGREKTFSDLIVTSPRGGYAAADYALYRVVENNETKLHQWYIDPLAFLSAALSMEGVPAPDFTTQGGERLFFTQIEGDGWNELSAFPGERTSAEIIRDEIVSAHPDLPFTLSAIGAELDAQCYGLKKSAEVARSLYALPNAEAATHTLSHPLFWRFFADYSPAKEAPYLSRYPQKPRAKGSLWFAFKDKWLGGWDASSTQGERHAVPAPGRYDIAEAEAMTKYYTTPRSYACAPFSLQSEIAGAAEKLGALAGKPVKLLTWSGDTQPFEAALAHARQAGLHAINGGEWRYNMDYPSLASVAPAGLRLGDEIQLYAANGSEGAQGAKEAAFQGGAIFSTIARLTGLPVRFSPLSLYAHMYAGRAPQELDAVKDTLSRVRAQPLAPVHLSEYAAIAEGFYSATLTETAPREWELRNRGALNTLRFDRAALLRVDFTRSRGVLGMRWLHGSLYVALDPAEETPRIALASVEKIGEYPKTTVGYLVFSRWGINRLQLTNNSLIFVGRGYGEGRMAWRMPEAGSYRVTYGREGETPHTLTAIASENGLLEFTLDAMPGSVMVSIERTS